MASETQYISISDIAKKAKVTTQTLRRWDRAGILTPAVKLSNGTRLYTPDQITACIEMQKQKLRDKLAELDSAQ